MTAATSNWQHAYGLGPRGPNPKLGADPANHQAAPPPSGPPRPEEQHHKPFFYVQPPQPYLPMQSLQWPVALPMPVSYNPYYGYPGLGYSLPMMSHYQTNPYLEQPAPGFVVPHTRLHLMDYRRVLNPQYYQTMAYHARRFRYQHNSAAKEMTSSEVQTEPLESAHRTSTQSSHKNSHNSSGPTGTVFSPALAVQKDHSSEVQENVPPLTTTRTPSNSSFVIQTEETCPTAFPKTWSSVVPSFIACKMRGSSFLQTSLNKNSKFSLTSS
ncbi:bucky ball [Nematolebias whitei]|uniref:bucky ball n=1 Tax=Nematolebias whitei TaxID=451745 RepID=UPI0018978A65|nr:bucky ball [Nematolebias whitei]